MSTTEKLRSTLDQNTSSVQRFLDDLDNFDAAQKPAPNTWSILECLEHMVLTDENIWYVFQDDSTLEDRSPEEKAKLISENFLDFQKRFRAFGPIAPQNKYSDTAEALNALKDLRGKMLAYGEEKGWNYLCTGFAHPLFGALTRAEWIYFAKYHAERHLKQMTWIKEKIEKNN